MNMKFVSTALVALGLTACAHPGITQVPPASEGYEVVLTATAPVASGNWLGCGVGQPQCTYAVYAETISGTACDPTTSTNYKEISTPTARPTTPNFTDSATTGLTRCYNMETVQQGANSAPSNVAGPIVSPGIPLAPNLITPVPQSAMLNKPNLRVPETSRQFATNIPPMTIKIRIVRTR